MFMGAVFRIVLIAFFYLGGVPALTQHFDPPDPIGPTSSAHCDALTRAWDAKIEYLNRQLKACNDREYARLNRECKPGSRDYKRCQNTIARPTSEWLAHRTRCGGSGNLYLRCDELADELDCARKKRLEAIQRCKAAVADHHRREAEVARQKQAREDLVAKQKADGERWNRELELNTAKDKADRADRKAQNQTLQDKLNESMAVFQDQLRNRTSGKETKDPDRGGTVPVDLRPKNVPLGKADHPQGAGGVSGPSKTADGGGPGPAKPTTEWPQFDSLVTKGGNLDPGVSRLERTLIESLLQLPLPSKAGLSIAGVPLGMADNAISAQLDLVETAATAISRFEQLNASFANRDFAREFGQKFLSPGRLVKSLLSNTGEVAWDKGIQPHFEGATRAAEERWRGWWEGPRKGSEAMTWWAERPLGRPSVERHATGLPLLRSDLGRGSMFGVREHGRLMYDWNELEWLVATTDVRPRRSFPNGWERHITVFAPARQELTWVDSWWFKRAMNVGQAKFQAELDYQLERLRRKFETERK